jgi:NhaP-type Na+/H+ or K+/H+ antiporter
MSGDYTSIVATSCLLAGVGASYLSKHLSRRFKLSHSTEVLVMVVLFLAAFIIATALFHPGDYAAALEYFRQ